MMELFRGGGSTVGVVRSAKTAVCFSTKQARRACVVDMTHTQFQILCVVRARCLQKQPAMCHKIALLSFRYCTINSG